jgi:uncharacterized membrane protein (UPF0127 family)
MALINASTKAAVATSVEIAQTSAQRRRGLLGRDGMAAGSALVITRCNAVHTFGMRFRIDVAFVDRQGLVRKVVEDLAPWRIALSPLATTVIEFPAGALKNGVLMPGDRVSLVGMPDEVRLFRAA